VPRVIVTGAGRPSRSLGCLGTVLAAFVFVAAVVLVATIGLVVLIILAAGVVVATVAFLVRKLFHLGGGGSSPSGGPPGVIDTTATEMPLHPLAPPPEGPEDDRH
jgi:hypothetical protein